VCPSPILVLLWWNTREESRRRRMEEGGCGAPRARLLSASEHGVPTE